MTRARSIHAVHAAGLFALLLGVGTVNAQAPGKAPPGAPPGTPSGTPTVIPGNAPPVAAPTRQSTSPARGAAVRPLGGSAPNGRGLALELAAAPAPSTVPPWSVALVPHNMPFRVGQCSQVSIDLLDASGKDAPRGPDGFRVSIADFDMTVSAAPSRAIVGQYNGASYWSACVCQGTPPGTVATITATYPARALAAKSRISGVAFQSSITLPVAAVPPLGPSNPPACAAAPPTTTVAASPTAGTPATTTTTTTTTTQIPTTTVATAPPSPTAALQAAPGQDNRPGDAGLRMAYFAPTGVSVTGTPAEARVTWQPSASASGYSVERWKETDPNCCRATSPSLPAATTNWNDLVQWTGPWVYRVTARFPDGSQQFTDAKYVYPEPQIPTGFRAVQTGTGTVTLSWQPVKDASYYLVGGPPGNTAIRVDGTSTVRTGVPAGNQSWMVATNYESSSGPQQGSAFANVALAVTASPGVAPSGVAAPAAVISGRYRVVATGFRVISETYDDMLSRDGKYDEVYGAFAMLHYDRTSSRLLDQDLRRTKVIGDVNNQPGRIQGGTASASGGLRGGDVFPAVADPSKLYGAEPTDQSFPFLIWQGTLTDSQDAVIILPTLWEYDGNSNGYDTWFANEIREAPRIWSDAGVQRALTSGDLGLITPPGAVQTSFGPTFSAGSLFEMAFVGPGVFTLFGAGSYDRPIGSALSGSAPVLPRRAIVLTREVIEAALRKQAAAPPNSTLPSGTVAALPEAARSALPNGGLPFGTIAIPLFDAPSPDLQGRYVLYIQVERIP